eukprot:gnl/MRDRNA2_/MRDRNA2_113124_c0_seq1.p1 gnl/MRDRNA2_/MRDRNA2_113124_c0~~gnl/MRDRNA2_/MRDRNA2_113124_c0_seq1.p1  ORF type:complete len:954 (+),score=156.07 gnl/MRDRNA2_/MRDRNA2_113124_c0_seq1:64-2925(+)
MIAAGGGAKAVQMLSPTSVEPVSQVIDVSQFCHNGDFESLVDRTGSSYNGQLHPLTADQNILSSKMYRSISCATFSTGGTVHLEACNCKTCRCQDWRCDEEFEQDPEQRRSTRASDIFKLAKAAAASGSASPKKSMHRSPTAKRMSDARLSCLDFNLTIGGDFNQQLLDNAQWQAPPPQDKLFRNASDSALREQRPSQKRLRLQQARENLRYKIADSRIRKRQMELDFVQKTRSRLEERHSAADVRRHQIDEMRAEVKSNKEVRLKVAKQQFLDEQGQRWLELMVVVMALGQFSRGTILWRLKRLSTYGSVFAKLLLKLDTDSQHPQSVSEPVTNVEAAQVNHNTAAHELGVAKVTFRPTIDPDKASMVPPTTSSLSTRRQSRRDSTQDVDSNAEVSMRRSTRRLTIPQELAGDTAAGDSTSSMRRPSSSVHSQSQPSTPASPASPSSPILRSSRRRTFKDVSQQVWACIHTNGKDGIVLDGSKEEDAAEINERKMMIYALQKKHQANSSAGAVFLHIWKSVHKEDDHTPCCISPNAKSFQDMNAILRVAIMKAEVTWSHWKIPLFVTTFVARLRYRPRRRENCANILKKFLLAATSQNAMLRAIRRFTWSVRIVQLKIKAWLALLRKEKMDVAETWITCEESELKRMWASADRKTLQSERDRLMGIRSAKDKENIERIIALTRENMKRYLHPKTEGDFVILRTMLDRQLLPSGLRAVTIAQIFQRKRLLYKKAMFCYDLDLEAYARASTTWRDIDQAIRMLDPHGSNPAPLPRKPKPPRLSTAIDKDCLRRIVIRVMRWYEENHSVLESFLAGRQALTPEQRWRQAFRVISGRSSDLQHSVIQPIIDVVNEEVDPENLQAKRNAQIIDPNVVHLVAKMQEERVSKKGRSHVRPSSAPPGRGVQKPPSNNGVQEEVKSAMPSTGLVSRPTSALQHKNVAAKAKGLTRKRGSLI